MKRVDLQYLKIKVQGIYVELSSIFNILIE